MVYLLAIFRLIDVTAVVDDRRRFHPLIAVGYPPSIVGNPDGIEIANRAAGDEVAVVVISADVLVQIQKLLFADAARVERRKSVLNADVVERPAGIAGDGVAPEYIDHVVINIAAHAGGIGVLVEPHADRNGRVAGPSLGLQPHRIARTDCRRRSGRRVACGRDLLRIGPRQARALNIVQKQVRLEDVEYVSRGDFREAATHDEAVEKTGVVIADRKAGFRSSGASVSDRKCRWTEVLDEALLHHHQALGRQHFLAIVAEDVQRR